MLQTNPPPPQLRLVARPGQNQGAKAQAETEAEAGVPHNPQAEESLLGSLLADRDTIASVAPLLKPEHFFSLERANLYRAILSLYADGTPPDLITVRNELKALGLLGEGEGQVPPAGLLHLLQTAPTPVHATHYAQIILKHWLARQLIAECAATVGQAYGAAGVLEPGQLLADHSTRLQSLSGTLTSLQPQHYLSHESSQDYALRVGEEAQAQEQENDPWQLARARPRLRWGWAAFDGRDWAEPPLLSLMPATLSTILARTGGGKTIAAMGVADANAQAGLNVLYFHVELNQEQMLARRYCRLSGVPVLSQLNRQLNAEGREALVEAAGQISQWPGRVDWVHCPNWSAARLVEEVKARHYALLAAKGRGYELVVLDYLQRLGRPDGRMSEHEALAHNVRAFSDCANSLNIAALMTSQVGRVGSEASLYEPPSLDEGLGSGDIERCSNQLLALAITQARDSVKWAIRKNTFGESGRSGELNYEARRLAFF